MSVRPSDPPATDRGSEGDLFELILAGRVWRSGRLRATEIGIDENGWIRRVARSLRASGERIDLGESVILPAATDLHVHFRDPGGVDPAESFASGTEGAALSGVTTVVDMPNTRPAVTDRERWEDKAARAAGRMAVDVVLFGAAVDERSVRSLGAVAGGFKLYLSATTGLDVPVASSQVPAILAAVSATGLPLSVHAEAPEEFRDSASPPRSTEQWNRVRPPTAEEAAVGEVLPGPAGLRLHVAHATLAATVDRVLAAGASCEATPHHLLLSARSNGDAFSKTNPPLRGEADRVALWEKFAAGRLPVLASDHAPHFRSAKEVDFGRAPSGVPGVQTMLPLCLELVREGRLSLPVLAAAAADRPARLLGLPVGRIAPGYRADLVAVDFRARTPISGRTLRSPAGWSPFEGWTAIFPRAVFLRGHPIVRDAELVGGHPGRVTATERAPRSRIPRREVSA